MFEKSVRGTVCRTLYAQRQQLCGTVVNRTVFLVLRRVSCACAFRFWGDGTASLRKDIGQQKIRILFAQLSDRIDTGSLADRALLYCSGSKTEIGRGR